MNWLWVAAASFLLYGGAFVFCLVRGRFSRAGLGVGLANLVLAFMHSVAPVRGWADPDYLGFSFGLIRIEAGFGVTVVAGAIFLLAAFSACAAAYGASGRSMLVVAAFDGLIATNVAISLVGGLITDPTAARIQLGEYLTIPALPATLIFICVFLVPLSLASAWAFKRSRQGVLSPTALA